MYEYQVATPMRQSLALERFTVVVVVGGGFIVVVVVEVVVEVTSPT
jgi:hypothetical protein